MRTSFLYLNAFSAVGGIQTFNRNFLKACNQIAIESNNQFVSFSLNDRRKDLNQFECIAMDSAEGRKLKFLVKIFFLSRGSDKIILGHFNLLFPLVLLFKVFLPKAEIILVAHGIEAWKPLPFYKKICLRWCHRILSVSNFTREKIIAIHNLSPKRIQVFPNTIDPVFQTLIKSGNPKSVLKKHGLIGNEKILFTLCRLSSGEKEKGYEKVIRVLPKIKEKYPCIKYILSGKEEDGTERKRVTELVKELHLENHVLLTGYLSQEEVINYYSACDVFIMPSIKEGFGIVFLEALAMGKPVIGGNKDGSKEALCEGQLGLLIDPFSEEEIYNAICNMLAGNIDNNYLTPKYLQTQVEEKFGFKIFYTRVKEVFAPGITENY